MKFLTLIIALCMFAPVFGQRKKKNDEQNETNIVQYKEGVMYSLPRTGIQIRVEASKTNFTPGPYAKYATQFLGIENTQQKASTTWQLKNVSITHFSEPDPTQVYKTKGETASLICLTSGGCIAGINAPGLVTHTNYNNPEPIYYSGNTPVLNFTNLSDQPFFAPGDSSNNFLPARIGIEQKAAEAATRILECRNLKFEMAAGYIDVAPPDGQGYVASINQLQKTEDELLPLFTGLEKTEQFTFTFNYIPSVNTNKGEVIFRFSEEKGVLEKTDLSGKPVLIEISKIAGFTDNYNRRKSSENPNAGESGVYYRIPAMASIKLVYELRTIASERMPVAQFGVAAPVPEIYLDGNYSLVFNQATGAIKNIIMK